MRTYLLRSACLALVLTFAASLRAAPGAPEASDAVLRVVTAQTASEVQRSLDQPGFEHDLVIEALQAVQDARVEVTDLVGPQRVVLACTVNQQPCSTPFAIEAGGVRTLRLKATLERAGSYAAVLSVAGGAKRQNVQLVVTRSATPFPVELAASMASASTRAPALVLQVPLQEKFGLPATLNVPTHALTRREGGKTVAEAVNVGVVVRLGDQPITGPWSVVARGAPVLQVALSGLDDAGEYAGRLRITSPSSLQVLDIPITVMKSDSIALAAMLIALGAAVSFLLRVYLKGLRPRLLQLRTASQMASDVERLRNDLASQLGPLEPEEAAVVAGLSERLTMLGDQIENRTSAEIQAVLGEVDTKLSMVRRWVNARRRATALEALPAEARNALLKVGAFLARAGAAQADTMETELAGAETKITETEATEARKRIDALTEAVRSASHLDVTARTALQERVRKAASILDAREQRSQLDAAEQALVDAQIAGLDHDIASTAAPPIGFDADSWAALSQRVKAALDAARRAPPAERGARLRTAVVIYLEGLHGALVGRARLQLKTIDAHASMSAADKTAYSARAQAALDALAAVPVAIAAGKLDEAARTLAAQGQAVASLQVDLKGGGFLSATTGGSAAEAAPVPAGLDLEGAAVAMLGGLVLRGRRLTDTTPASWRSWIGALDLLVFAVALVLSVLLGLKLLWVDNATWGSVNDYVVALLWGLGLHQISNATFEGIAGMVGKFEK